MAKPAAPKRSTTPPPSSREEYAQLSAREGRMDLKDAKTGRKSQPGERALERKLSRAGALKKKGAK